MLGSPQVFGYDERKALYDLDRQVPCEASVRTIALRYDFPAIWVELKTASRRISRSGLKELQLTAVAERSVYCRSEMLHSDGLQE